jgi:serine palmitoyltransferase
MNDVKLFTLDFINSSFNNMELAIKNIPFATNVLDYAVKSFQNDPERLVLEVFLVIFLCWYFFRKAYQPGAVEVDLTEKEIDALIAEWEPEPLCNELTEYEKFELNSPTFTQTMSLKAKSIDGKERLNFSAFNFCGLMNSENIKSIAIGALRTYGVGTCGPPGFYGTLDCHMELEKRMAEFIGHQDSILYSQGFSCISSVLSNTLNTTIWKIWKG